MNYDVGLFGPGKVGMTVARLALAAGHRVRVLGSARQTDLQMLIDYVAPGAEAASSPELLVGESDLLILAVPFGKSLSLPYDLLNQKIVVDAMNYWPPVDGEQGLTGDPRGSSEIVASRNPRARWVKSLNHLGYHAMDEDSKVAGAQGRRAMGVASNDDDAKHVVMSFVDSLGFDPVDAGTLAEGRLLETDGAVFGRELEQRDFERLLRLAEAS
jgi:predicted dinucleotide-binding enzyme